MQEVINTILQKVSLRYPQTPFAVEYWDGTAKIFGRGPEKFRMIIKSRKTIKKILVGGTLAFGEEYSAGNIDVAGDIQEMLKMAGDWREFGGNLSLATKTRILFNGLFAGGTISNSKKNISFHYDIDNDFYSLWLDSTMGYSCAYFRNDSDSLEAAQINKYDHICKKLRLQPGEKLLDVGCGWGGMMFHAAKQYGAKCVGYTLSKNQYDYVSEKIESGGWGDSVKVVLDDYRRISGVFDKFVSVGMFEHVGKKYYPEFFNMVKRALKPRGIGVLHTIGSRAGEATDPWIAKYIFPGGFIPSLGMISDTMNKSGMVFYDVEDLRMHYAKTLDFWRDNFDNNAVAVSRIISRDLADTVKAEVFVRMWRLYLNSSAVAFKTAGNRLYQITFTNGANNSLPLTRGYIYSV
ncbi:MAG: cyclopropane-fatty-acyl-phospholipid synthase family protein [Candidatus Paceibacterota bacterium]